MGPLLFLLMCVAVRGSVGSEWSYEDVDSWPLESPKCGGGHRQSPINFVHVSPFSPKPFTFHNYKFINTTLENNGHSLNVMLQSLPLEARPRVSGGNLPATYFLDAFHFHWGANSQHGSEHLLGDCAFTGEMHLVHVKEEYESVSEALKHEDGLAVLGVWLVEEQQQEFHTHLDKERSEGEGRKYSGQDDTTTTQRWLTALTPTSPTTQHARIHLNLHQLLPKDVSTFYRYEGSLTTPPCTENVLWTVFASPVVAPRGFLRGLRSLVAPSNNPSHNHHHHPEETAGGATISDNFRPTQTLGDRKVYYSGDVAQRTTTCNLREKQECLEFPPLVVVAAAVSEVEYENDVGEGECRLGSPLDLHLRDTQVAAAPRLAWKPLGNCQTVSVANDGQVLRVRYSSQVPQWELVGGDLEHSFFLGEIVLRWGSEHYLAGFSFPLEVQLVHYNAKYKNLEVARGKADGVVVVVRLFQEPVGMWGQLEWLENEGGGHNHHLHLIIAAIQTQGHGLVGGAGTRATVASPDIRQLMGHTSSYYEYRGSLPGASCSTPAIWLVLRKAGEVSQRQLAALKTLRDTTNTTITSNPRQARQATSQPVILRVNSPQLEHEFKAILSLVRREVGKEPDNTPALPSESCESQAARAVSGMKGRERGVRKGEVINGSGNGGQRSTPTIFLLLLAALLIHLRQKV